MFTNIVSTASVLLLCVISSLAGQRSSPTVTASGAVQACFVDGSIATGAFELTYSGSEVAITIVPMTTWPEISGNLADVYIGLGASDSKLSLFIPGYATLTLLPGTGNIPEIMSWLQQVGGPPWTSNVTLTSAPNGAQTITIRKAPGVPE